MLVGGVWADRLPRQWVMLTSDLVRGMSQAAGAALLLTGAAELWHLAVIAALHGAGAAFFVPASSGIVPDTVSAARLQQANALMGLSRHVFGVAGPALAGILVAAFGPGWVYAIDRKRLVPRPPACRWLDARAQELPRRPRRRLARAHGA
jgi:MFS family permease